jgi:hypothetical protein
MRAVNRFPISSEKISVLGSILSRCHGTVNLKFDCRTPATLKYLLSIFRPNG